ncbi:LRP2-binding protein [Acanthosepion pharaonis]|uniref:LRP2-binding protein n=1 Tax=Acanthosepion pharaonis TaxID=158019 RepID=A0A812AXQ9_ACAPH|nr:LRP2-binding protein [Sepia pharaonis]
MEPWRLLPVAGENCSTSQEELLADKPVEELESLENEDDIPVDEETSEKANQAKLLKNLMTVLKVRAKEGNIKAHFLLGQLYFEQELYKEAKEYFEKVENHDLQGLYQLGVMYYDGLGITPHPNKGFKCLIKVASSKSNVHKHLIHVAQYCIGLAYFQGFGIQQSYEDAERWWLLAADNGHPQACVKAQSMLGMFYSVPDYQNFERAFFWHTEACGNGNLESQGALGVMYKFGIGVHKNKESAFICLKEAANRGNVYAMGILVCHYYDCKMFTNAVHLGSKVNEITDFEKVAQDTDCLYRFILKGVSVAIFYLGRCFERGAGIRKSLENAQKCYLKSFNVEPQIYCDLVYRKHHLNL